MFGITRPPFLKPVSFLLFPTNPEGTGVSIFQDGGCENIPRPPATNGLERSNYCCFKVAILADLFIVWI